MEFPDVVRKRRMIRHFTPEPVPEETVKRIVSMAQRAPNAGFSQGVVFVAVTDEAMRKRVGEDEIHWPIPYWHTDAGCSLMLVLLAAVNEGLGSAFVGVPDPKALQTLLNIPAEYLPIGVAMIGHAAPDKKSPSLKRGRRKVADVLHVNGW